MKEAVFKLKEPVIFGQETITEIKLQQPKAKHLRGINMSNMQFDDFLTLISSLSGMPTSQVDEIALVDLMPMVEVMTGFLDAGPKTGNPQLDS